MTFADPINAFEVPSVRTGQPVGMPSAIEEFNDRPGVTDARPTPVCLSPIRSLELAGNPARPLRLPVRPWSVHQARFQSMPRNLPGVHDGRFAVRGRQIKWHGLSDLRDACRVGATQWRTQMRLLGYSENSSNIATRIRTKGYGHTTEDNYEVCTIPHICWLDSQAGGAPTGAHWPYQRSPLTQT